MRRLAIAVLLTAAIWVAVSPGTLAQMQQLLWMDEGVPAGRPQFAADCVGAGISCSVSGGTVTLNVAGAAGGYATVQDDGTPLTQRTTINFTGSPITCSDSGGITVCNVVAGAGNFVEASVAVTSDQPNPAPVTVAAAWVGAASVIVCGILGTDADGLTPEAINVAGLHVTVENRVAATSFDVRVANPYGLEGTVRVQCTGS